jgi:hypothetical protein
MQGNQWMQGHLWKQGDQSRIRIAANNLEVMYRMMPTSMVLLQPCHTTLTPWMA